MTRIIGSLATMEPGERFNTTSHALGLVLGSLGLAWLLGRVDAAQWPLRTAAVAIFGATALLSYTASVLYHGTTAGRWKQRFERLDHAAIYLLIAGTATPFVASGPGGFGGWALLAALWAAALALALRELLTQAPPSVALYLLLGWLAVATSAWGVARLWSAPTLWLLLGALCYSAGAWLYRIGLRQATAHGAWHVCALCGTGCHLVAVGFQLAP